MTDVQGAVGHPNDTGAYLEEPKSYAGKGWHKIWGFLDGIRGVTDRVEGVTGDVSGIATKIAEGKRSLWELSRDRDDFDQSQLLEKFTTLRGDNKTQMYVIGAVAVAIVVVFGRK